VEPTSEPETAILEDVKLKLSRSEAVEFQTAPEETPELHQATMPVPSYESTWPSSVTVEKVLIKYKTQLWIFQPKLVAEQLMLTDVSGCAIIVEAGILVTPSAQIWHSLVQGHSSH
jgi:hypothetical protein